MSTNLRKLSTDWQLHSISYSENHIVQGMNKPTDIHLARTGLVTHCNYQRLGYQRLARGVYGHVVPISGLDTWQARQVSFINHVHAVMAAYAGKSVVLYGSTALQVLGVALPTPLQDWNNCHLLVPAASRRPERSGVIAHRTHSLPPTWRMVDGLPVLHPVDHLLQLGNATIDQLVEVGDGLMRRRKSLLTFDQAIRRISELDGVSGVKRVRRAAKWFAPPQPAHPHPRSPTATRQSRKPALATYGWVRFWG